MNQSGNINSFNVNKLLLSKWTATTPIDKQKHFIVTELITELIGDESEEKVIGCVLEAVINKQAFQIDWQELKDADRWIQGWK